ncbi:MAG TPA: hypothetical protein VFF36_19295 [Planctomycetota bacterium]|jgi:predicted Zn-ribbon and HTH transcriptional regulator|nr:hypothetical protein [Planctomycetota bacterium]
MPEGTRERADDAATRVHRMRALHRAPRRSDMDTLKPPRCAKCGRGMDEGLMIDRGHGNQRDIAKWLEGPPERGLFGWVKTRGKRQLAVVTFRCNGCGYLESYAPPRLSSPAPRD